MAAFLLQQGEYLLRILIGAICGAAIGYERKSRMKEAGVRTHLIVALGSTMMMLVSKYGFFDVVTMQGISLDASRIAANIITGVSFLGAGVIFVRNRFHQRPDHRRRNLGYLWRGACHRRRDVYRGRFCNADDYRAPGAAAQAPFVFGRSAE